MTTYTLAITGVLLLAMVADGEDVDAAVAEQMRLGAFEVLDFVIERGCTLTNDRPKRGDGQELVYISGQCGWLVDERDVWWDYAIRRL